MAETERIKPDALDAAVGNAVPVSESEPPKQKGMLRWRAFVLSGLYLAERRRGITLSQALEEEMPAGYAVNTSRGAALKRFAAHFEMDQQDRRELDTRIGELCPHKAAPLLEKLILRMAITEIGNRPDTPPAVVVNEAVNLANAFGSEGTPGLVNAALRVYVKSICVGDNSDRAKGAR